MALKQELRGAFGGQFDYETARDAETALEMINELAAEQIEIVLVISERRELPAQVEFRKACFLDMDASDGTFDHVICCNVWPHLSDAGRSIAQAWSLLNSPGEFWICHLCGRVRLNHIHRSAGHAVHDHQLPPAAELAEMVAEQGFVVLDCEDSEQLYWIHSRKGSR